MTAPLDPAAVPPRDCRVAAKSSEPGLEGPPPSGPGGSTPGRAARRAADPAALPGSSSSTEPCAGVRGGGPGRGAQAAPRPGHNARTWTLELPAGMPLLSLNGREHWTARHTQAQAFKQAAWVLARQAKIPHLRRVSVAAEYQPPDRRRRDADNPIVTVKACIDGIVAAGVLEDDASPEYVTGITCSIGPVYPKGRIVLHLTEVVAEPARRTA